MKVTETRFPGLLIIEPQVHADPRGFFQELYHQQRYTAAGLQLPFVQDNHSRSRQGTLRGLHYQLPFPQGKLVWAVKGEVFDVAVDLRRSSPTFGCWSSVVLSETNHRQVYVPPGMAHGFYVLSETAEIIYKCTEYYRSEHEHSLRWDDPDLAIAWPSNTPVLSERDRNGLSLREARCYE